MRQDAEQDGKPRWATEKDSRITTVGNILRRSRIDELPQILNVLRGEMSFIGPRPERPEFVQILSERIPHYELRHLVRPGLTGWAQVHYEYASSEEETAIKLSYDLFYVKNRSLALDLKIILKTILVIIERKGR
jgi:lipopolysaccharide/colanic/teichoic acid biosynthesis glycosyltransferase